MKSARNITAIEVKLTHNKKQSTELGINAKKSSERYEYIRPKKISAKAVAKRLSNRRDNLSRALAFLKTYDYLFPNGTKVKRVKKKNGISQYSKIIDPLHDGSTKEKDITPHCIKQLDHSLLKLENRWGVLVEGSSIYRSDKNDAINTSRGERNVRLWVRDDGTIFTVKVVKIKTTVKSRADDFAQEAAIARDVGGKAHQQAGNASREVTESDKTITEVHYFLDEFQGYDLAKLISANQLSSAQLIEISIQCFERIEELRKRRYVHLDIKPDNFAVKFDPDTGAPIVTLLDFGFAKKLGDPLTSKYQEDFRGTTDYMTSDYQNDYKTWKADETPNKAPFIRPFNYTTDIFAWTASVLECINNAPQNDSTIRQLESFKDVITKIQEEAQEVIKNIQQEAEKRNQQNFKTQLVPETIKTSMETIRGKNQDALKSANEKKQAQLAEEAAQERKAVNADIAKKQLKIEADAIEVNPITVDTHTKTCSVAEELGQPKIFDNFRASYDQVSEKRARADAVVNELNDSDSKLSKILNDLKWIDKQIPNNTKIKRSKKKNGKHTYTHITEGVNEASLGRELNTNLEDLKHSLLKVDNEWFVIVNNSSIYQSRAPSNRIAAINTRRGERNIKLAVRASDGAIFSIKIIKTKKSHRVGKSDNVEQEADTIYAAKDAEAYAGHRVNKKKWWNFLDDDTEVDYLLEEFHGHSLRQYLDSGQCSLKNTIEIFIQCFEWIEILRTRGYAHVDIKPENFAVKFDEHNNPIVTLIDFGFATALDDPLQDSWQGCRGTPGFIPNAYKRQSFGHFNYFTDILAWTTSIRQSCQPYSNIKKLQKTFDDFLATIRSDIEKANSNTLTEQLISERLQYAKLLRNVADCLGHEKLKLSIKLYKTMEDTALFGNSPNYRSTLQWINCNAEEIQNEITIAVANKTKDEPHAFELLTHLDSIADNIHTTINAEINNNPSAQRTISQLTPDTIRDWMMAVRKCNNDENIDASSLQGVTDGVTNSKEIKDQTQARIAEDVTTLKEDIKRIVTAYNTYPHKGFKHGEKGRKRAEALLTAINDISCTSIGAIRAALKTCFQDAANHNHSLIHFFVTDIKQNENKTFVEKHGKMLGLRDDIIKRCKPVQSPTKTDKEARKDLIETLHKRENPLHVSDTVKKMQESVKAIAALYMQEHIETNMWLRFMHYWRPGYQDAGLERAKMLQKKVEHAESVSDVLSAINAAEKDYDGRIYNSKDSGTHAHSLNSYFEDFLNQYEETLKRELPAGKRSIFEEFQKKSAVVNDIHAKNHNAKDARRAIKAIFTP